MPNTQRSTKHSANQVQVVGATSGRSSVKHSIMPTSQSSHTKMQFVNPVLAKSTITSVNQKLSNQEKQQDKENKQRLSNKPQSLSQGKTGEVSKRNKTNEVISRQSVMQTSSTLVNNQSKKTDKQLSQNSSSHENG